MFLRVKNIQLFNFAYPLVLALNIRSTDNGEWGLNSVSGKPLQITSMTSYYLILTFHNISQVNKDALGQFLSSP